MVDEEHHGKAAADAAGLRWVSDTTPGIRVIEAYERSALVDDAAEKTDPHAEERAVLNLIARCNLPTEEIVLPVSVRAPEVSAA